METGTGPRDIHFREYLRVLRKRFWLIFNCLLVVIGTVAIGTYLQRPVYQAVTKALIERERARVVDLQEIVAAGVDPRDTFLDTQVQIIRSRPVVQRVIDSLGLMSRKPELAQFPDPVVAFLWAVRVEPIRNTSVIEIRADDPDPGLAAEIANSLANAYVRQNLELRLTAARDAFSWLTAQVTDLKDKVNESELAFQRYKEQAGIVSAEEKQTLAAKKLAEFNSAYIDAKAKRLEMETRLTEIKRAARNPEILESAPMVTGNPLIQRLKAQLVELEVQRSKLLKVYKEKHPELTKVQSQVDEISQKLREEIGRLAQGVETEHNALKAREAAMLGAVNQYRDEAQSLAKKEIQLGILKRDSDSNQQLYEMLLKRLKETSLSQGLDTNNVRIVDPAVVPAFPIKPRTLLNLAVGFAAGLALGLGLAFFVEYMDDTVRTPDQVERTVGVPLFALVPVIPARSRS